MAFVEHLDDSYLFDSMYAEDVEGNKLSYLPGVGDLLGAYPSPLPAAPSDVTPVRVPPAYFGQVSSVWGLSFCETLGGKIAP